MGALRQFSAAACVVASTLSLVACSTAHQNVGTLTGHLRQAGGPAPGVNRPVEGTVSISGPDNSVTLNVGRDGLITADLPAGTYTDEGHSPTTLSGNEQADCPAVAPAVVTAGQTSTSDAICSIK